MATKRRADGLMALFVLCLGAVVMVGCGKEPASQSTAASAAPTTAASAPAARGDAGADEQVTHLGSVEVTAQLVEVPPGAIIRRELYDYAAVLPYRVLQVHRGQVAVGAVIYVGQYNPFKPRAEAADRRVPDIGGTATAFVAGQVQRMALEQPLDDYFMGGLVNPYFDKPTGPLYWALWTNQVDK